MSLILSLELIEDIKTNGLTEDLEEQLSEGSLNFLGHLIGTKCPDPKLFDDDSCLGHAERRYQTPGYGLSDLSFLIHYGVSVYPRFKQVFDNYGYNRKGVADLEKMGASRLKEFFILADAFDQILETIIEPWPENWSHIDFDLEGYCSTDKEDLEALLDALEEPLDITQNKLDIERVETAFQEAKEIDTEAKNAMRQANLDRAEAKGSAKAASKLWDLYHNAIENLESNQDELKQKAIEAESLAEERESAAKIALEEAEDLQEEANEALENAEELTHSTW
jgi:hypothetical protein